MYSKVIVVVVAIELLHSIFLTAIVHLKMRIKLVIILSFDYLKTSLVMCSPAAPLRLIFPQYFLALLSHNHLLFVLLLLVDLSFLIIFSQILDC